MLLEKYKEKLPDDSEINDLIDNWDTLDVPTIFLDLPGCIIPDKEEDNAAPNDQRFIICPTEHSAFHVKLSCSKGEEAKTNASTNKLITDKHGPI